MSTTTATATAVKRNPNALPFNGSIREEILAAIRDSANGLTDEELQTHLEMSGNTVRPRRGELAAQGRIRKVGTRLTEAGRQAAVWVANEIPVVPTEEPTPPKSVTIIQKRGCATLRSFKSFVTVTGPRSQVITFPQTLSILPGDTLTIR